MVRVVPSFAVLQLYVTNLHLFFLFSFILYDFISLSLSLLSLLIYLILCRPSGITMKAALGDTSVIIPQRGDVITFSFTSCSQWAVPLDPKICRIRRDLSWNDVVNSTAGNFPFLLSLSPSPLSLSNIIIKQKVVWASKSDLSWRR